MNKQSRAIHQVAVVGLGRFGLTVAKTLFEQGSEVFGIDSHEDLVQRARDVATHCVQATLYDMSVVRELGLNEVDAAVVAIGNDQEMSIVSTALLAEAGVPYVVARAYSQLHGTILSRVGAHRVVYPEVHGGRALAHTLRAPEIIDYLALGPDAGISTVHAPATWFGRSLAELRLPERSVCVVLAIQRDQNTIALPPSEERIEEGDVLALLVTESKLGALESWFREPAVRE